MPWKSPKIVTNNYSLICFPTLVYILVCNNNNSVKTGNEAKKVQNRRTILKLFEFNIGIYTIDRIIGIVAWSSSVMYMQLKTWSGTLREKFTQLYIQSLCLLCEICYHRNPAQIPTSLQVILSVFQYRWFR